MWQLVCELLCDVSFFDGCTLGHWREHCAVFGQYQWFNIIIGLSYDFELIYSLIVFTIDTCMVKSYIRFHKIIGKSYDAQSKIVTSPMILRMGYQNGWLPLFWSHSVLVYVCRADVISEVFLHHLWRHYFSVGEKSPSKSIIWGNVVTSFFS